MTYLIIAAVLLFIIAIRQAAKARNWKRKNKEIYRKAIIEKHSLQHRIDQLEAGRA